MRDFLSNSEVCPAGRGNQMSPCSVLLGSSVYLCLHSCCEGVILSSMCIVREHEKFFLLTLSRVLQVCRSRDPSGEAGRVRAMQMCTVVGIDLCRWTEIEDPFQASV